MSSIALAGKLITTLVRDRVYYPGRLVIDTVSFVSRCALLLVLYWYVFEMRGGEIAGVTFNVVAWGMFFYFALSTLRMRDMPDAIMDDVRSGTVEVLFTKPISYFWYRAWWQIGAGLYPFLVISISGGAVLAYVIGIPATLSSSIFLPTFIAVCVLCVLLQILLYGIVGLLAFWIEDIHPVFWIIDKSTMVLGGSYLPIALFPEFLYKIAIFSPLGASQFVTHTVYESWSTAWPTLIGMQVLWVLVLGGGAYMLFKKAAQKMSINGG